MKNILQFLIMIFLISCGTETEKEAESGRKGEWESGRKGEKGRVGDWESG